MNSLRLILAGLLIHSVGPVFADQEAPNTPIVKSSEHGRAYAKSVPEEVYGSNGKTFIYAVHPREDSLLHTFNWYANQVYLLESPGSVVRLGPWARGHEPSDEHLAIGFYVNGRMLKEYSTLSIVNLGYTKKENIGRSVSHYTVFEEILGYRWLRNDKWAFDVQTHEGRTLSFDVSTGQLRSEMDERNDQVIKRVQDLKVAWFVSNRDATKQDDYDYKLTTEELRRWAGDRFPEIPSGYILTVGAFFEEVRLAKAK